MKKLALAVLAAASVVAPAAAAPIFNPANGHYYEFIQGQVTWQTALANAAAAGPFMGLSSHLGTITSAAESAFVFGSASGSGMWLAGTDQAVEGTWRWVAGPENGKIFFGPGAGAAYSNFGGGEPNNCCGGENFLHNFNGSQL